MIFIIIFTLGLSSQSEIVSMTCTLFKHSDGFNFVKVIKRLKLDLLEQDVTADPIRQKFCDLILDMSRCRNREDVVEFFQGSLFRF